MTRTAADLDLAARDPALPGLSTLLDDDAFVAALRGAVPGLERARAEYVRYKPHTSCLVAYRLHVDGKRMRVYARAQRFDDPAKLRKVRHRARNGSPLGATGLLLPDLAVAVLAFPYDRRIRPLADVAARGRRRRALAAALPDRSDLHDARLRVLRYKPERRLVGMLLDDDKPLATIRTYGPGRFGQARAAALQLSDSPAPAGQPVLAILPALRSLVLAWCEGQTLSDLLDDDPGTAAAAGEALRALHAAAAPALPSAAAPSTPRTLRTAVASIEALCPALTDPARAVARRVRERAVPGDSVTVHGDFSADQVLVRDGSALLLDLDAAGTGEGVGDLATFLAHLDAEEIAGRLTADAATSAAGALLDGYGAVPPGLGAARAAALLARAVEPFRHREHDWDRQLARLVDRADVAVDGR